MKNVILKTGFSIMLLLCSFGAFAQNEKEKSEPCKIKLNLNADIVSRYIWRGIDFGNSPAVQPSLSISSGNFEAGIWGSVATQNAYKELDIYAKYAIKNFTITFTDYYIPFMNGVPASPDPRISIFANKTTAHTFEGSLTYKGGEKLPLWISANTFFYGNDKRWGYNAEKDSLEQTYFSTYFEAGYTFACCENSIDVFMGGTPFAGQYGKYAGIMNVGISVSRKIKITESYALPVKASFILNPQTSDFFFVFGISIN